MKTIIFLKHAIEKIWFFIFIFLTIWIYLLANGGANNFSNSGISVSTSSMPVNEESIFITNLNTSGLNAQWLNDYNFSDAFISNKCPQDITYNPIISASLNSSQKKIASIVISLSESILKNKLINRPDIFNLNFNKEMSAYKNSVVKEIQTVDISPVDLKITAKVNVN